MHFKDDRSGKDTSLRTKIAIVIAIVLFTIALLWLRNALTRREIKTGRLLPTALRSRPWSEKLCWASQSVSPPQLSSRIVGLLVVRH